MTLKYGATMSTFQLLLLLISAVIAILFFKQLFSGSFPKRGVDFDATKENEQIGAITQKEKIFSEPTPQISRITQLLQMAQSAMEKENYIEADKALTSANIIEPENQEVLLQQGYVLLMLERLEEAKEVYESLLKLNEQEDMAHGALANVLHKLGQNEEAKEHHLRAIALDKSFAPHQFNYANTLYDLDEKEEALNYYKSALVLDGSLEEAKKMITELTQ